MREIFLEEEPLPGKDMILMPSDVYENRNSHNELQFRSSDLKNLAHNIDMIASFEQELQSYLTKQDGLESGERKAMIKDTLYRINGHKDHLVKILTGYYKD